MNSAFKEYIRRKALPLLYSLWLHGIIPDLFILLPPVFSVLANPYIFPFFFCKFRQNSTEILNEELFVFCL